MTSDLKDSDKNHLITNSNNYSNDLNYSKMKGSNFVNKQVIRRILLSLFLSVLGSYILLCIIKVTPTPSINHHANAWSSITYAVIDGPITVRLPLYILSVASFNLWAHSTQIVNFIDV